MRETITVSKNASPGSLARRLGLPKGRYLAFDGTKNNIYLIELQVLSDRGDELFAQKRMSRADLRRLRDLEIDDIPSGNYHVRKTRRAYSLEQAA